MGYPENVGDILAEPLTRPYKKYLCMCVALLQFEMQKREHKTHVCLAGGMECLDILAFTFVVWCCGGQARMEKRTKTLTMARSRQPNCLNDFK
jgi:hypothetical protein